MLTAEGTPESVCSSDLQYWFSSLSNMGHGDDNPFGTWDCSENYYSTWYSRYTMCAAYAALGAGCSNIKCPDRGYEILTVIEEDDGDGVCRAEYVKASKPVPPCCGESWAGCDKESCYRTDLVCPKNKENGDYCNCVEDCFSSHFCGCDEAMETECCNWAAN